MDTDAGNKDIITVGATMEAVGVHMENCSCVDDRELRAWNDLADILLSVAALVDEEAMKIIACAWCKQVSASEEQIREHIKTCKHRERCE